MEECLFCKMVAGQVPRHRVYEDDKVLAFLDIHPINAGHLMVIPKKHFEELWDLDDEIYNHVMAVSKKLAIRIKEVLQPYKVGVIVEGMEVPHAHYHLVPLNEGIKQSLDNKPTADPDHAQLALIADKLRIN